MADVHHCYDPDGDVSRYMLDDMEFPLFPEPNAATLPVLPVEARPTPASHVEPPPAADLGLGHPVHADLGFDVDLDFFPELNFQPQPPATNADGYTHQSPAMLHQHQQPLAPSPVQGDDGFFLGPSPGVPGSPLNFNFVDINIDMGGVDIDDVLMWGDDGTHGAGAGDTAPPDVDEYANCVPFQAGDLECSNCHLVREVMHTNVSRTIYFLVHATGVGSFQHAIVDRRYPAGTDGLHVPGSQLLYFDLTNHTVESANNFIASNIEKLRNDTSGHHFLDTGYNISGAVRADMTNSHTAMEMKMLHTIVSAPAENASADAAPPSALWTEAPPAAELPAPEQAPAPQPANEQNVVATFLLQLEEFYATANSRPAPKKSEVKILESSQVTQQDGGSCAATATMYPSMVARKRKRAHATPSRMAPHEIIEYLRVTAEDTDKEVEILNNFFEYWNKEDKASISFPVEQIRNIKKKTARIHNKSSTIMPSRLMANFVDEIDTIKEEKAKAFEEIIKALKNSRRKEDDGSSSRKRNVNIGGCSGSKRKAGGSSGSKRNVGRPSAKKARK